MRKAIMRFHQWSASPIPIPRSLCLLVIMFVIALSIGAFARQAAKPVKFCPTGETVYPPIRYL